MLHHLSYGAFGLPDVDKNACFDVFLGTQVLVKIFYNFCFIEKKKISFHFYLV